MADNPLRQGILKVGQASPAGSVLIEPRAPAPPRPAPAAGEHESHMLRELHDSLRLDPEALAAERTADRILAEAAAQRDSLLSSANREAEEAKERMEREVAAMQQAAELELAEQRAQLIDGLRRELEQQFSERYVVALQQLESAATDLVRRRAEYLRELEQPALELVLQIARQLLGCELSRQPQFMAGLIADAYGQLQPQPGVRLALNPATLELLLRDDLLAGVLAQRGINLAQLELQSSPALQPDQFELQAGLACISFDLTAKTAELIDAVIQRSTSGSAAGQPDGGA